MSSADRPRAILFTGQKLRDEALKTNRTFLTADKSGIPVSRYLASRDVLYTERKLPPPHSMDVPKRMK